MNQPALFAGLHPTIRQVTQRDRQAQPLTTADLKLAERCIKAGSKPGDLVLDPFGGSGTTVKVARSLNRRGVMLDLNPAYLDLAKQRNANLQPSLLETEASA